MTVIMTGLALQELRVRLHECINCEDKHFYTGCLNIYGAHVTANNSTNNNVFFIVSDLCHYLFGDKII